MWLESIKVSYHPAKVGRHRHYGIEDRIILVCHVVSQDHVSKGHVTLWEIKVYPMQRANLCRLTSLKKIFTIQICLVYVCVLQRRIQKIRRASKTGIHYFWKTAEPQNLDLVL